MVVSAPSGTLSKSSGLSGMSGWAIVAWLCLSHHLLHMTSAEMMVAKTGGSSVAKDDTPLALSSIPSSYALQESKRKQFPSAYSVHLAVSPAMFDHASRSQITGRSLTSSISGFRPTTSAEAPAPGLQSPEHAMPPQVLNCCGPNMVMLRGGEQCHCVYPVKVDLLLLNVSQTPKWDLFLEEFASGLGLSVSQTELINFYWLTLASLNISMDITPDNGISFSADDVSAINTTLSWHKLYLNSNSVGVGDYKFLSLTWYQPPAPTPAPLVAPPKAEPPPFAPIAASNSSLASKKGGKHTSIIVISSLSAILLVIASVTAFIVCNCSARPKKATVVLGEPEKPRVAESTSTGGGSVPHPSSMRFIPYEELKQATNNFEAASLLGEGGFGRVYGGVLSDGTPVAIKRLTNGGQQGDKEFLVEVEMLSRLHHRNLVKLLGYYSSRQPPQNLLCYELVSNGSLESWLHGPVGDNCPLDWDTRMRIALDAARGLAYLHEDSQPCVIHRDFKASNILLENDFHAKVADFGLAKQAPEGQANYLSTRVMGTFGYVAPEYAMTGHLLVKSDVYSYGVVLLELITGRPPVDMLQPSGQENLVTWTRPILRNKDRLEELADQKLQGTYPKEDFVRVCTIAAACVASEANQRPTMGEVVQSLKMVQRVKEHPEQTSETPAHKRSTTFDSDGTSSIFSSGPYSGLIFDHDNISRTAGLSEDLHEGR